MFKVSTWLIAFLMAIGLTWELESVARAEDHQCVGTVNGGSHDNIIVPDGQSCILNGTQVGGNIVVGTNSSLQAHDVSVEGNVQAEGSTNVVVSNNSTVDGSIQIKQGGAANVTNVTVSGDIQFENNSSQLVADGNTVGGNLQAFQNSGGLTVQNNDIDGNLQCKENNPAPVGGNNQAASLEDQCANLDGPVSPTPVTPTPATPTPGTPTPTTSPTSTSTPPPSGGDEECVGTIGESFENLFVPDGQSCILNGTQVDGNIIVGTNSSLRANNINVGGNIQAEGSSNVVVNNNSRVDGNIQIKQGRAANVTNVNVNGDIQFENNSGQLVADGNTVGGNLQAFQNSGGLTIQNNDIDGNLQCKENNPAPAGGNNQAASLEDQCANLSGPVSPTPGTPTATATPGTPTATATATPPSTSTPPPSGGDAECTGSIGAQNFENLFVPNGQTCILNGARVDGNIVVGTNATLQASNINVGGNIQAEGATNVSVNGASRVGGSVQIKQGDAATIVGAKIEGDLQFEANNSALRADNNIVGGNLQATGNSGGLTVRGNNMDGNLQCTENSPPPDGGNNRAASLEDQCATLSSLAIIDTFVNDVYLPGIR